MNNIQRGSVGILLLIFFVLGGLGIYWGYNQYMQTYYVGFYDGNRMRYLDVPPFAERITSSNLEILGECDIRFSTIDEQVLLFFQATASKNGYSFSRVGDTGNKDFEIFIRKDYIIKGTFEKNILKLRWTPILPPNLQKKARQMK